jgi:hypothetical protein
VPSFVGLGKSGTTALVYAIPVGDARRYAIAVRAKSFVELEARTSPPRCCSIRSFRSIRASIASSTSRPARRDSRDILVSKGLYRIYGGNPLHADLPKPRQYVELLRAKERDPRYGAVHADSRARSRASTGGRRIRSWHRDAG